MSIHFGIEKSIFQKFYSSSPLLFPFASLIAVIMDSLGLLGFEPRLLLQSRALLTELSTSESKVILISVF